jgi:hypothetical protein
MRLMKLTKEQLHRLLRERGIWVTNACDKCGQLLGSARWTRRGELGEWCSATCRDGIKSERLTSASVELAAAASVKPRRRMGSLPSGRPRMHATNAEKQRSYRSRLKNGLALRNTPSEVIENAQLVDAKNRPHVVGIIPATQTLETALSAVSSSAKERARGCLRQYVRG